ncbi:hypothetical protein L210DRAFT_649072 [Boletus edulis BED1]|uniref:Uncharacterized protein n=1 Tax=Boletus edulis BED1 TaxID=1328754 RepID=A0AAD4BSS2_BOLED|nr:hypothetical protein L210DRAFT_649072 [Boletus edulis BED1]
MVVCIPLRPKRLYYITRDPSMSPPRSICSSLRTRRTRLVPLPSWPLACSLPLAIPEPRRCRCSRNTRHSQQVSPRIDAMEGDPVENTVDERGIARNGVDDGPRQVLDRSQQLHLFAPILSFGERDNVDVRVRNSDAKMGTDFRGVRHGRCAAQVRVHNIGEVLLPVITVLVVL